MSQGARSPIVVALRDPESIYVIPRFLNRIATVVSSTSCTEARELIDRHLPSVLVLEPDLQDGDATCLIATLRQRVPWAQVLCICDVDQSARTAEFITAGASDVLVRPFDIGTFLPRVEHLQRAVEVRREQIMRTAELEERIRHLDRIITLGTLVATLAHETANPLTTILGNAEELELIFERPELPPAVASEASPLVREIITACRAITTYIRQLRAYSRRDQHEVGEVLPQNVLDIALSLLKVKIAESGAEISVDPPPAQLCFRGQPIELAQALSNAISNAVDAAGPGGHVAVRVVQDGDEVAFEVEDDGAGVPKDLLQNRQPFFTTKPGGTGLGLGVMMQVMERHGGRVEIHDNTPRPGTRVRLVAPLSGPPLSSDGSSEGSTSNGRGQEVGRREL